MSKINFHYWANNERISSSKVYDFFYSMVEKYNLEIGYEDDISDVHLYYKEIVILHFSVRGKYIFLHNRFTNSANRKLSQLAKLKLNNANKELYENFNTNEIYRLLNRFYSKKLFYEDVFKISYYIEYTVEKIIPSITNMENDFVFSERVQKYDFSLMKIHINENLYVNDLQNLLNSIKNLYSTLLFLYKFSIENPYDYNLFKYHDFLQNIDESTYADDRLILNNIIIGSEGSVAFAGLTTIFDLINSLIEIFKKTKEISILTLESAIKEEALKDAKAKYAFNALQRLMTLTKQREDANNASFITYIDNMIAQSVEVLEEYSKDPRSFEVYR